MLQCSVSRNLWSSSSVSRNMWSASSQCVCMQEYMTEMTHCLARLDVQSDSPTEGRLQQLTFEAFMLAEETFRMRACDNNAKAMTLCRWHEHAPIPEHVYVKLLVSHCNHHVTAVINAEGEKSVCRLCEFQVAWLQLASSHVGVLCCACEHLTLCFYPCKGLVPCWGILLHTDEEWSRFA